MPRSPTQCAGNVNMKGRKFKLMRCRCCYMFDFRDKERAREDRKYVAECLKSK